MIGISNADRDKAVEFIRAYASMLQECGMHTTTQFNARRMALNLAKNGAQADAPGGIKARQEAKATSKVIISKSYMVAITETTT